MGTYKDIRAGAGGAVEVIVDTGGVRREVFGAGESGEVHIRVVGTGWESPGAVAGLLLDDGVNIYAIEVLICGMNAICQRRLRTRRVKPSNSGLGRVNGVVVGGEIRQQVDVGAVRFAADL